MEWLSPVLYLLPENRTDAMQYYLLWILPFLLTLHSFLNLLLSKIVLRTIRTTLYSLPFLLIGLPFAVTLWILHWLGDYFISKFSSSMYMQGKHQFSTNFIWLLYAVLVIHFSFYLLYLQV